MVTKWREPEKLNGLVDYILFATLNGTERTICQACGESYKLEDVEQYTTYTFWVVAYNIKHPRYRSGRSTNVTITTPSFSKYQNMILDSELILDGFRSIC